MVEVDQGQFVNSNIQGGRDRSNFELFPSSPLTDLIPKAGDSSFEDFAEYVELPGVVSLEEQTGAVAPDFTDEVNNSIVRSDLEEQVRAVLGVLTFRERQVIRLRWGLSDGRPRKQIEIGKELGCSQSTVSRSFRSALGKLRSPGR